MEIAYELYIVDNDVWNYYRTLTTLESAIAIGHELEKQLKRESKYIEIVVGGW